MNIESGIQIGDIWGIVRRRGKAVAAAAMTLGLAAYWVAMALPNRYSSFATVLVMPQTVDPSLVAAGIPESDLNNRLFLMTAQILSRGRLSRIIDELELYQAESGYMVRQEVIDLMRTMVSVAPVISELSQQQVRRTGQEAINQFKITFTDYNARTAMLVAQKLSNDFIEQHIESRISQSQKSLEFIEGELGRLATRIRDIEARVAEVKNANPGRLPEDMGATQRRLERLISNLAMAQRAYAEAVSDEAFFRSQLANTEADYRGEATPAGRLKLLELAVAELRSRGFTDKHPDLIRVKLEMEQLLAQIARQIEAGEADDRDLDSLTFAQQDVEAERRRAALRKDSASEEISRIQAEVDGLTQLLAETPAVAEILDGLEREYRHLFTSYQDFSNRQLEAMVQAQLERRQLGEQFRVLEAAFIAPEPASPNRMMIIVFGVFFAVAAGLAVGVILEAVDGSVHSARQLQAVVGIPVLAAIPRIQLEADLAAQRRSRMLTVFGAVAVTAFALVGGFANYVWVNGTPGFLRGDSEVTTEAAAPAAPAQSDAGDEG